MNFLTTVLKTKYYEKDNFSFRKFFSPLFKFCN